MLRLTPGDPAAIIAGDSASPDQIEDIRDRLGLNDPLPTQLVIWSGKLLQGDFGESFFFKMNVSELIMQRVEPTLALAVATLIITLLVAIPLGVIARSEEHTSELQSLMRTSYAVFCLKKKNKTTT